MSELNFKTKKELEEFVSDLEKLQLDLHGIKPEKRESYIKTNYDSDFLKLVSASLPNALDTTNGNMTIGLEELLSTVKGRLKNTMQIRISVAFQPDEEFMKSVYGWFGKNVGGDVLLDIETDKNILGGAVISSDGKYKDYSVAAKLKNYDRFI